MIIYLHNIAEKECLEAFILSWGPLVKFYFLQAEFSERNHLRIQSPLITFAF